MSGTTILSWGQLSVALADNVDLSLRSDKLESSCRHEDLTFEHHYQVASLTNPPV